MLGTPIELPASARGRTRILSCLLAALLGLAASAAVSAQETPEPKPPERAETLETVLLGLLRACAEQNPDQALRGGWPLGSELSLGTFGTDAAIRWKTALQRAGMRLERLQPAGPSPALAEVRSLEAWVDSEVLLVDSLGTVRTDPSRYVRRVIRTLQALRHADGIDENARTNQYLRFVDDLPAYWRDARTSLVSPSPVSIDVALVDLEELDALVAAMDVVPFGPPAPPDPKAPEDPRASIATFREWLLDEREIATTPPERLGRYEWTRFVQLRSGFTGTLGELKARCLRDLGAAEATREIPEAPARPPAPEAVARSLWNASAHALALGQAAGLLDRELAPEILQVTAEPGPATRAEALELTPGATSLFATIHLPGPTWPREQARARLGALQPRGIGSLGVRYGLAGAGAWMHAVRCATSRSALLDHRELCEGFGLFALEWTLTVDLPDNPLRHDPEIDEEFARQRGLEMARFLAALELHAEEAELTEVETNLRRRTGMDRETAHVEALNALADPAWGIGALVAYELRALRGALAASDRTNDALARTLALALQYPYLRPVDLSSFSVAADATR